MFRYPRPPCSATLATYPPTSPRAREAEQVAHADGLLDQLKQLTADARRIQEKAERAKDYRAALAAVRELVRIVDLVARLSGELQPESGPQVTAYTFVFEGGAPKALPEGPVIEATSE